MFNILFVAPQQKTITYLYDNKSEPRKEFDAEFISEIAGHLNGDSAYFVARLKQISSPSTSYKRYLKIRERTNRLLDNHL